MTDTPQAPDVNLVPEMRRRAVSPDQGYLGISRDLLRMGADEIEALTAERDALRGVINAARATLKRLGFEDSSIAIEGLDAALSTTEGEG